MTRCSSILNGAGYLCYAAETALPIAAACTNKSSLTYATLPFAFLGTVFFCWRLTSTYRTPGVHNLAHLIGLGTSIASAAVNAGSVAFK
ncbi:MAG TPA: hypothetical protein VLE89_08440, partial [Chlamydiales bacterium]|nr:hypothetical protein [Chlamydiales bacterium]